MSISLLATEQEKKESEIFLLQTFDQDERNKRCRVRNSPEANQTIEKIPNGPRSTETNEDTNRVKNETTMRPRQVSLRNSFSEIEGRNRKRNTINNVQHTNDAEF